MEKLRENYPIKKLQSLIAVAFFNYNIVEPIMLYRANQIKYILTQILTVASIVITEVVCYMYIVYVN